MLAFATGEMKYLIADQHLSRLLRVIDLSKTEKIDHL